MQNVIRSSIRLVDRRETRCAVSETLSLHAIAENVLMFAAVSVVWAIVIVMALQAAQ